ncbi:hypothetical protein UCDDA912_g10253 [Diaporthe ampelina]|uniref:Uncharacterized protein n=1 Tax=Diaporthe ampelina TaxID=1214573 RepID=A0A0G2HNL1_9PEZI|nr:hypothetical protein UCDDA912_g10253 [Diaporthe ampelina]
MPRGRYLENQCLCSHNVADLNDTWATFDYDLDSFPVPAQALFCAQTIADIIAFIIQYSQPQQQRDDGNNNNNNNNNNDDDDDNLLIVDIINLPGQLRPGRLRRANSILGRLLWATQLMAPFSNSGEAFLGACCRVLRDGVAAWLDALVLHGVLVRHRPQRGGPFDAAGHWEWCAHIVGPWDDSPRLLLRWVMVHVLGMGPMINERVQDARNRRMQQLFDLLTADDGVEGILNARNLDDIPPRLRQAFAEYSALRNGRPWNPRPRAGRQERWEPAIDMHALDRLYDDLRRRQDKASRRKHRYEAINDEVARHRERLIVDTEPPLRLVPEESKAGKAMFNSEIPIPSIGNQ